MWMERNTNSGADTLLLVERVILDGGGINDVAILLWALVAVVAGRRAAALTTTTTDGGRGGDRGDGRGDTRARGRGGRGSAGTAVEGLDRPGDSLDPLLHGLLGLSKEEEGSAGRAHGEVEL